MSLRKTNIRKSKKNSVCYILSYYSPKYIRTRTLVAAMQSIDNIEFYQARNSYKGIIRYFQTLWKLIIIRILHNPKVYVLGFRGVEIFFVVRLITLGKYLVFDHMVSPYDSLVNEHKTLKAKKLISKLIFLYEKNALHCSDVVLVDTASHKKYFQELFYLNPKKIIVIPVGSDDEIFHISPTIGKPDRDLPYEVLFYGSFLPLHGVDIILKAAEILQGDGIHFTLIGGHKANLSEFREMVDKLNLDNIKHLDWIGLEHLPQLIARADISLGGPFGGTGQAHRVITGKTFQALSMAKPVIIGANDEVFGFMNKVNCLVVPQRDEKALADAIYWAFSHQDEMIKIGLKGYELYQSRYSIKKISEKMRDVIL